MKASVPKRTAAQLRKRESDLLEELCAHHGYMFSDTLPARDRATTLVSMRQGERMKMKMGVAFKIMVPEASALGAKIMKMRKQKEQAKLRKLRKP